MIKLKIDGVHEHELSNIRIWADALRPSLRLDLSEQGQLTVTFDETRIDMVSLMGALTKELNINYENIHEEV